MNRGVYCLLFRLDEDASIRIGALGNTAFKKGYYIYVGSALGAGGLLRVSRHIRFHREHYRNPKWHVDYLSERAVLLKTFCAETDDDLECRLASAVGGACVPRFGCSDCGCESHLFYRTDNPEREITDAFSKTAGVPVTVHTVDRIQPKQTHRS